MLAAVKRGPEPPPIPRVERTLTGLGVGLLLLLILVGAPFVLKYRSEGAHAWGYSPRYAVGVLIPFGMLAVATLGWAIAGFTATTTLRGTLGRLPRLAASAGALAAIAAALVHGYRISDEYVSVLTMIALPCAVALAWGASFGKPEAALACLPLLGVGIAIFGIDLPGHLAGSPLAVWGDPGTFATLFPREPPYIGPGGRLRPHLDVRMRAPEYRAGARLVTNGDGLRNDREFASPPAPGEMRVLSLGDSFSTGFAADQDAFFGSLLERDLEGLAGGTRLDVLNAEVSDPAYGLYYLQQFGMRYQPALVLYGLSGNDLMQAEQFCGDGRLFHLDDEGMMRPAPTVDPTLGSAWERYGDFVYAARGRPSWPRPAPVGRVLAKLSRFGSLSALAGAAWPAADRPVPIPGYTDEQERADGHKRLIDGAANLGFSYKAGGDPIERMYAVGLQLVAAMARTAADGGARFLLVIHPQRYQVRPKDWEVMKERWGLSEEDFDLRLANRRIDAFCRDRGIECCDLVEPFARAARTGGLYLPCGDTHFNRYGHETAAASVAQCVLRVLRPHTHEVD